MKIGDHVTVTGDVTFVTHDGGAWIFRQEYPDLDCFAPIEVGDNVFIGVRSVILPGVRIGKNCVIGAGSVVTRSIPDNSVACGVPARVIGDIQKYKDKLMKTSMNTYRLTDEQKRPILEKAFGLSEKDCE